MKLSVPVEAVGAVPLSAPVEVLLPRKLLIVSENEQSHIFVRHLLARAGWQVSCRFGLNDAAGLLAHEAFPVVLCDRELTEGNWRSLLTVCQEQPRPPRLIVFDRLADAGLWAEVLNLGAYDLLVYPFDAQEISRGVTLASESWAREAPRTQPCSTESKPSQTTDAAPARLPNLSAKHIPQMAFRKVAGL